MLVTLVYHIQIRLKWGYNVSKSLGIGRDITQLGYKWGKVYIKII